MSISWFESLRRRLRAVARKEQIDVEMDEEMRFHLEMEAEEIARTRGIPVEEARRQAVLAFGGMERYREEGRDARGLRVLEELWRDVRFAMRMSRRHLGFSTATVLTLALGIGASTAVFSVVHGVLLKPLPFEDSDRLVTLFHAAPALDLEELHHGPATYFTYLEHQRAFEEVGAWELDEASVTGVGDPEHVEVLAVTQTTLPALGVGAHLGRILTAEDDKPGAPPRAVLSYGYWQRAFGGAANVLGRTITLDGVATEVIGVLPESFRFLESQPAAVVAMRMDPAEATNIMFDFQVVGRLRSGLELTDAVADIERMIPLLPPDFEQLGMLPRARLLADDVVGEIGNILWILLASVGVVLLIACGNVANLFLSRAEARQREFAMRSALGGSRWRIARVLLSESLFLGLLGGAVGVLLAQVGLTVLRLTAPADLPRIEDIGIDGPVLLFALGVAITSGAGFGLFTALGLGKPSVALLREGRGAGDSIRRNRARDALVVFQVALALMLMVGSGLMVRTLLALRQVDPGFTQPETVQTFRVSIPESLAEEPLQAARMYQQIAEEVAAVPGVRSLGISSSVTMDGEDNTNPIYVEGRPIPEGVLPPLHRLKSVAPGYFEVMGNPVLAGRAPNWTDILESRDVVVVSEPLAREYWGSAEEAIGRRIGRSEGDWYDVVGVVGAERDDGLDQPATTMVYWPLMNASYPQRSMAFVVRSDRVGTPAFLPELRQAVWSVNPNLPLSTVQTLEEIYSAAMARTSFMMVMLIIAAAVALLIGMVGIYGVIAYVVTQRTREIGIRVALGAQTSDVRRLFMRHGLVLTFIGVGLGVFAALALTRLMSSLLFGVSAVDPMSYAAVAALVATIAAVATYLPVRRATRVDPIEALRVDA